MGKTVFKSVNPSAPDSEEKVVEQALKCPESYESLPKNTNKGKIYHHLIKKGRGTTIASTEIFVNKKGVKVKSRFTKTYDAHFAPRKTPTDEGETSKPPLRSIVSANDTDINCAL